VNPTASFAPSKPYLDTCKNLGHGFSEGTSLSTSCYPDPSSSNNYNGFDNSVSVFVGGSFNTVGLRSGGSVEGNIVVLGDFRTDVNNSPTKFVSTGGSNVLPGPGHDCIIVGGIIKTRNRDVHITRNSSPTTCNIIANGSIQKSERWKVGTGASKTANANYDLTHYNDMICIWRAKSEYWKGLASTPGASADFNNNNKRLTYTCSTNAEIQVFNILSNELNTKLGNNLQSMHFNEDCEDKTILINVHSTGTVNVKAVQMKLRRSNGQVVNLPSCMTQNILWNFPHASLVRIGGNNWTPRSYFHGSILALGNLKVTTLGHQGRLIVVGNLTAGNSANTSINLRNYQFKPPIQLPDLPQYTGCSITCS